MPEFAVIAENEWGLDERSTQILATRERAVELVDTLNRESEGQAPIRYRLFVLREVEESAMWDWATSSAAYSTPMVYVNERAARASVGREGRLWRRRVGSEGEWEEVASRG